MTYKDVEPQGGESPSEKIIVSPISDALFLSDIANTLRISHNLILNMLQSVDFYRKYGEIYGKDLTSIYGAINDLYTKVEKDLQPVLEECKKRMDLDMMELWRKSNESMGCDKD